MNAKAAFISLLVVLFVSIAWWRLTPSYVDTEERQGVLGEFRLLRSYLSKCDPNTRLTTAEALVEEAGFYVRTLGKDVSFKVLTTNTSNLDLVPGVRGKRVSEIEAGRVVLTYKRLEFGADLVMPDRSEQ
jgi:hypothetical protein